MSLLAELELEQMPDWNLDVYDAAQLTRFSSEFIRQAIRQGDLMMTEPLPRFRRIRFIDLATWFDALPIPHPNKLYTERWGRFNAQVLSNPSYLQEYAQKITRHAHRIGALIRQPCEICGEPKSHAHHDDYSQPLAVRYLCNRHHKQCHAEQRRQQKALNT